MTPFRNNETLQLLQGGQALFPAYIQAFDAAQHWIQMETYIFDFYGVGAEVADALIRAAKRGVTVQVLVDAIGSGPLAPLWDKKTNRRWSSVVCLLANGLGF